MLFTADYFQAQRGIGDRSSASIDPMINSGWFCCAVGFWPSSCSLYPQTFLLTLAPPYGQAKERLSLPSLEVETVEHPHSSSHVCHLCVFCVQGKGIVVSPVAGLVSACAACPGPRFYWSRLSFLRDDAGCVAVVTKPGGENVENPVEAASFPVSNFLAIDHSLQDKYPRGGFKNTRRPVWKTFQKVHAGKKRGSRRGKPSRHATRESGMNLKVRSGDESPGYDASL